MATNGKPWKANCPSQRTGATKGGTRYGQSRSAQLRPLPRSATGRYRASARLDASEWSTLSDWPLPHLRSPQLLSFRNFRQAAQTTSILDPDPVPNNQAAEL